MPVAYQSQYADLVKGNTQNGNVREFSTGDDVLDIVENGSQKTTGLICNESGCGERHTGEPQVGLNGGGVLKGQLDYERWGIFFTMKAQGWLGGNAGRNLQLHIVPCQYHVRCGNTVDYSVWNVPLSGGDYDGSWLTYNSYQGSKPLNSLYFKVIFMAIYTYAPSTPCENITLEISAN